MELFEYRDRLFANSARLGGEIAQVISHGELKTPESVARWYSRLSEKVGISLISSNNSHLTSEIVASSCEVLICMKTEKFPFDGGCLRHAGNEFI